MKNVWVYNLQENVLKSITSITRKGGDIESSKLTLSKVK